jgi:hypothetical protein
MMHTFGTGKSGRRRSRARESADASVGGLEHSVGLKEDTAASARRRI